MNKFISSDLGGLDYKLNDIRWDNDAFREALVNVLLAFGNNFILTGCVVTGNNVSAGYVLLDGELLKVDAHTKLGDYFQKSITYDPAGLKTFNDKTSHNTYQKNRAILITNSGNLAYNGLRLGVGTDGSLLSLAKSDHKYHQDLDIKHYRNISIYGGLTLLQPDSTDKIRLFFVESPLEGGPFNAFYFYSYLNWSGSDQWVLFPLHFALGNVACPFLYIKNDNGSFDFYSEVIKNQNNIDLDKEDILTISKRYVNKGKLSFLIKEEKDEISHLNYIKLYVDDIEINPESNPFSKKYISIKKGQSINIEYNIPNINDVKQIKLIIKGYYTPLNFPKFLK
jgi:hypothetical protein